MVCMCCGEYKSNSNWTTCPFAEEIGNDYTQGWHCRDCDYDCAMEI